MSSEESMVTVKENETNKTDGGVVKIIDMSRVSSKLLASNFFSFLSGSFYLFRCNVHRKKWGSDPYFPRKKVRDEQKFRDKVDHPEKCLGIRPIPTTFSDKWIFPNLFSAWRTFHERLFGMSHLLRANFRTIPKILSA